MQRSVKEIGKSIRLPYLQIRPETRGECAGEHFSHMRLALVPCSKSLATCCGW